MPSAGPDFVSIFLSYTSEDQSVADAIANTLRAAFDEKIKISMMSEFQSGLKWRPIIDEHIDRTDVLIAIATGRLKPGFSFTGYEIGSFNQSIRSKPQMAQFPKLPRRMVPFAILDAIPDTINEFEGVDLDEADLHDIRFDAKNFSAEIEKITDDPKDERMKRLKKFIFDIQDIIADALPGRSSGLGTAEGQIERLNTLARGLLSSIFEIISSRIKETEIPKSRVTIRVNPNSDPIGSPIIDVAGGPHPREAPSLAIGQQGLGTFDPLSNSIIKVEGPCEDAFNIVGGNFALDWKSFTKWAAGKDVSYAWRKTFRSLIERRDDGGFVDNSVIISYDRKKLFRLFLSKITAYYSGVKDYEICVSELLRRKDYGDPDTTILLKALQVSLGYRFMFLEPTSEFSPTIMQATAVEKFKNKVFNMVNSLNLLLQLADDAKLGDGSVIIEILGRDAAGQVDELHDKWEKAKNEIYSQSLQLLERPAIDRRIKNSFIESLWKFCATTHDMNRNYVTCVMQRLLKRIELHSANDVLEQRASYVPTAKRGKKGKEQFA